MVVANASLVKDTQQSSNEENLVDFLTQHEQGSLYVFLTKCPWQFVKEVISASKLEDCLSNSKDRTFEKMVVVLNELKKVDKIAFDKIFKSISFYAINSLSFNKKAFYPLALSESYIKSIIPGIEKTTGDIFNFIDTPLNHVTDEDRQWFIDKNYVACFFFSFKQVESKTKINPNEFDSLKHFDQIFGYEKKEKQFFDAFFINKSNNKAYLVVDISETDNADFCLEAQRNLLPKIRQEIHKYKTAPNVIKRDLFSTIEKICLQEEVHLKAIPYSIHEMNFISRELTRYTEKKSPFHADVRKDLFHIGGFEKAKKKLVFYKVSFNLDKIIVDYNFKYKLLASIPGTYKRAVSGSSNSDNANYFTVSNCLTYSDFLEIAVMVN
ncbi:hypothetical protein QU24_23570 [Pantoea rodasii]|uniref:Uncharacterized protein n=1 Tax=Pantoea rodasii TaxID=1076549 RepID=A0A0B1R341_9GAMM|nr:hypothetical protein [Pantoea rodasii]KHJ65582.1 hypothetical protein QU24_23570 [Pantoea rodasii]